MNMDAKDTLLSQDYFTPAQLAAELNKSERTLTHWRDRRVGPPVTRLGNALYYRKQAVVKWLLAQESKRGVVK